MDNQSIIKEQLGEEIDLKEKPIEEDEKLILSERICENEKFEEFSKNFDIKIEKPDVLYEKKLQVDYIDKCNDQIKLEKKEIQRVPFVELAGEEIDVKEEPIEQDEKLIINNVIYENEFEEFTNNIHAKIEESDILCKEVAEVDYVDKCTDDVKSQKKDTHQPLFIVINMKNETIEDDKELILNRITNENDKLKELNVGIKVEETDILCKEVSQMNYINKYNKIKSRKKNDNQQHEFGLISLKTISENNKDEVPASNTFKTSNYINQTDLNDEEIGSDDGIDMDSNTVDELNLMQGHNCFKFKNIRSGSNKFKLIDTGDICDLCKYNQKLNINKEIIKKYQVSADKKFNCQKCDYSTYYRSNMKKHLVVHDNVRPFKCISCDKRFKRNGDLKSHSCRHIIRNSYSQRKAEECNCSKYKTGPSTQTDKESSKHCHCDVSRLDNGLKKHIQDKWAVITKQITSVI